VLPSLRDTIQGGRVLPSGEERRGRMLPRGEERIGRVLPRDERGGVAEKMRGEAGFCRERRYGRASAKTCLAHSCNVVFWERCRDLNKTQFSSGQSRGRAGCCREKKGEERGEGREAGWWGDRRREVACCRS